MGNKLTNEEIAKVFAMYFGGEVSTIDGNASMMSVYPRALKVCLNQISMKQELHGIDEGNGSLHRVYLNDAKMTKLILTPLSSISDEDAVEVAKIIYSIEIPHSIKSAKQIVNAIITGGFYMLKPIDFHSVWQYLISKGYDVPLYFSPNHWANGLTAIELGIGIKK